LRSPVRGRLVRVELVDLAPSQRVQYGGLERVGERRGSCLTRGLGREVGELVPDEELVPEGRGGHPTIEAG
jgi:hypothetical protein